jgi:hypothetical protein
MEEDIYYPSVEEFRLAFIAFVLAASSVAILRARRFGPMRLAYISRQLADEFAGSFTANDAGQAMAGLENSKRVLGALFEEFVYIACKYRTCASEAGLNLVIPGNIANFADERGDALSDEAVDDIETVKGSIAWLLEKLPKWAQRIVEVLLEALKLTKGG